MTGFNGIDEGVGMEVGSEFRQVFLPYCLMRLGDGSYVVLNRRYKPVGISVTDWVDYETYPVKVRFKRALSAAQIARLDCKGRADGDRIYLYNDGCVPTHSHADWQAYSERLERLAAYKVLHDASPQETAPERQQ